jgi:hypothetical protein
MNKRKPKSVSVPPLKKSIVTPIKPVVVAAMPKVMEGDKLVEELVKSHKESYEKTKEQVIELS